ncbi:MAG: CPXCG motif-containing cysteine-rich protein [Sedimenticola sp.]
MNQLSENSISCPYCGESIDVLIDCSEEDQEYIEDCQVCCRPIIFKVNVSSSGEPTVLVHSEDETC